MDERDVIFARMRYDHNNEDYQHYYNEYPEKKEKDDYLRSLPQLGVKENILYDELLHPFINTGFEMISDFSKIETINSTHKPLEYDLNKMSSFIKEMISGLGARAKIIKMSDDFYYDIKGRPLKKYNTKVDKSYRYGIIFSIPMDLDLIKQAPKPPEMLGTIQGYMQGATISLWLTKYLQSFNYRSKAQYDGNYDVVLPLVAQAAGLGQIGYNGLLIDEFHGPRVRLGLVLTDIPLIEDSPKQFNFRDVCKVCKLCQTRCIAQAIKDDTTITSVVNHELCYEKWRIMGTDCAFCLATCPFSSIDTNEYDFTCKDDCLKYVEEFKSLNNIK